MIPQREIEGALQALKPAFDRSRTEFVEVWIARCRDDLAQLWHDEGAWAVTEVLETKTGRTLRIVAWSGRWSADLLESIETWARSVGCVQSVYEGRKGWLRRVPEYKLNTVSAVREL